MKRNKSVMTYKENEKYNKTLRTLVFSIVLILLIIILDFKYQDVALRYSNEVVKYLQRDWGNIYLQHFLTFATLYPFFGIIFFNYAHCFFKTKYLTLISFGKIGFMYLVLTCLKIMYSDGRPYMFDKDVIGIYCETECTYGNPSAHSTMAIVMTSLAQKILSENGYKNKWLRLFIRTIAMFSIYSRFYFGQHSAMQLLMGATIGYFFDCLFEFCKVTYEKSFLLRLSLSRYDGVTRAKIFSYITFVFQISLVITNQVYNYEKNKNHGKLLESWTFIDKCPKCTGKWSYKNCWAQSLYVIPVDALLTLCFSALIHAKPTKRKHQDLSYSKRIFRNTVNFFLPFIALFFVILIPAKTDIVTYEYLKVNLFQLFVMFMSHNMPQFLFRILDSDTIDDYIDIDELTKKYLTKNNEKTEEDSTKKYDEQLYGNPTYEDPILKDGVDQNMVDRKQQEKLKKRLKGSKD